VGNETVDAGAFQDSLEQLDFSQINQEVAETEGMEKRVLNASKDLDAFPVGRHSYSILIPDKPEDFEKEKIKELGVPEMRDLGNGEKGWIVGGYKEDDAGKNSGDKQLRSKFFSKSDVQATKELLDPKNNIKWYKPDYDTHSTEVEPKAGVSDTQFITNILENTNRYKSNEKNMPIDYPEGSSGHFKECNYNCHSFNNSVLKYSGALDSSLNYDHPGLDPGRSHVIPKKYFEAPNSKKNAVPQEN